MFSVIGVNVDVEGSGDIVLVSGQPGKIIKIFRILLTVKGGSPTVTFKSGTSPLAGTFHMHDGGNISLGMERRRWAECAAGEDLIINLSESAKIGGALTVWIGDE